MRLEASGAEAVVITQVEVEGLMGGSDLAGLAEVLAATELQVVASGGVGTLADLVALDGIEGGGRRLAGAIVGTAIYEGRLDVAEAVAALRGGRSMRTARIIPCLDVDAGRVVKGVNFVDLVDAGDPVELAARYDAMGADELVFLDITASSSARDTIVDVASRVAEQVFIPFTIGGGIRSVDDARRLLRVGADKVSLNTAAVERPELISRDRRRSSGRSAAWWPSTPGEAPPARPRCSPTAVAPRRASTPWPGPGEPRRSVPGRSCSPRWTATAPRPASTTS